MPVKRSDGKFVQFKFFPGYYNSPKYISRLTVQNQITTDDKIVSIKSNLIVDGGNAITSGNTAILTEKVFKENPLLSRSEITEILKHDLAANKIVFTPALPYEITGHIDGMLKFINENTLLVADYSCQSTSWQKKMNAALKKTGLKLIPFPDATSTAAEEKNSDGDYTALGCYINFLVIRNIVLLPQFNLHPHDQAAISITKQLYPNHKVIPVDCREIAVDGGVLNCISWNYDENN
jgi:agmatine deiminase